MEIHSHPGKSYFITVIYYLACICLGMATAVLGPTLQGLANSTGASLAQISALFLFSSFGYLIGSFVAGNLFDRIKGHPILAIILLILALMMGVVPITRTLLLLEAVFFIIGIAEGHLDVGLNTLIVWLHGKRVPPFMNGLHAFYGIGTTTAPLIVAAVLSSEGSMNSIYRSLAIIMVPIGLLMLVFRSPSHIQSRQLANERPTIPVLVFLLTVVFFAFTGAELGFGGWIFTFTTYQAYGNPALAANINAVFWGAITVGRLISIPLVMKLKPQKILWINFCGIILSLLIVTFFSSHEVYLWLGTIGTGLFMASTFPTLLNDAQSRMHMTGKVTGIFFAGSSIGSMTLPWIMGQLITPYGPVSTMIAALCGILVATAAYYLLGLKRYTTPAILPNQ